MHQNYYTNLRNYKIEDFIHAKICGKVDYLKNKRFLLLLLYEKENACNYQNDYSNELISLSHVRDIKKMNSE